MKADELGAILFTSGGTGRPKGVAYTHAILCAQIEILRQEFSLTSDDIDMPGLPLFSLFVHQSHQISKFNVLEITVYVTMKCLQNTHSRPQTVPADPPGSLHAHVSDGCILLEAANAIMVPALSLHLSSKPAVSASVTGAAQQTVPHQVHPRHATCICSIWCSVMSYRL